ncbi:Cation diffusion facilitator family protein 1 [Caenorhabditis elegans]|uniref:Isoform a of Cation diffusion facilitator family protein 1 n=1 Tax=Caenorhabditis elegans TaxID=6239 RepID=Q95QW4-3|nr:Cation diffusion facilitator family protein 1 [Caenorhabditis elegans]CCD64570.2 Cation diffusion facilitator family protein 1 [Caenorhabditis elegans]
MPVTFETPPSTAVDDGLSSTGTKKNMEVTMEDRSVKADKADRDDNNTTSTELLGKMRQTKVIDNCSHGTHTLEHDLRLKGEPIGKSESVKGVSRSLIIQIGMTVIFCALEFITGVVCSSIAMLADSYHMAADVMALIVAFTCIKIATRPSTRLGYGWVRAETLGGFFNGIFMCTVCVLVFQEAVGRIINVHMITHPLQVLVIGFIGLLINLFGMFNLSGHGHSHGGGSHGHSHGGSHGHSHNNKKTKKNDGHGHSHANGHGHSHDGKSDCNGEEEPDHTRLNGKFRSASAMANSDANVRLLDNDDNSNDIIERRLSGVNSQNTIIATVDRQMTPYGTHMASEVLNVSSNNLDKSAQKTEQKKDKNVNIHGVWLHLLSDAFGSVIVMISAGFVYFLPTWKIAAYLDPILSISLASIMGFTAVVLVKTSGEKLLKQTPEGLDLEKVKKDLCSIVGVSKVEKLSVWTLCGQRIIAAAHVNICHPAVFPEAAYKIKNYFHDLGVHSTTIEPTFEDTCMQSMRIMVKKVVDGKSIEEPVSVSTENEITE